MTLEKWLKKARSSGAFDSIKNQKFKFDRYILKHRYTWDLFQSETLRAIDRKESYLSATLIISRIREGLKVTRSGEQYKVDDHSRIYFAKLFVFMYPEYKYIFKFRQIVCRKQKRNYFRVFLKDVRTCQGTQRMLIVKIRFVERLKQDSSPEGFQSMKLI